MVPLAVSCEVPLIMDETIARTYGLPGLVYKQSVLEVLDHLERYEHRPYVYVGRDSDVELMRRLLHGLQLESG